MPICNPTIQYSSVATLDCDIFTMCTRCHVRCKEVREKCGPNSSTTTCINSQSIEKHSKENHCNVLFYIHNMNVLLSQFAILLFIVSFSTRNVHMQHSLNRSCQDGENWLDKEDLWWAKGDPNMLRNIAWIGTSTQVQCVHAESGLRYSIL